METRLNTTGTGLTRDLKTKALLNRNMDHYENILRDRKQNSQMSEIKTDVETLKCELNNIKSILQDIANLVRK
jgi:DNA-binding transcriptional regulator GbsR (MarR family)